MMALLPLVLILTCLLYLASGATLIFQEEFNSLNYSRWQPLITAWRGGNNEFQYYTNRSENWYIKNGSLFIKPTFTSARFNESFLYNGTLNLWKEGCNFNVDNGCNISAGVDIINPIQSARIRTVNSFSFTYGTVEVRAKMPRGDWLWPAIWMLPTNEVYGTWPRSGEIDIVEVRGNDNFTCQGGHIGNRMTTSTLHYGPIWSQNGFLKTTWSRTLNVTQGNFSSDFHVFQMQWLPTGITFSIDNQTLACVSPPSGGFWDLGGFTGANIWANGTKMAPFDQKFHFVLNVAVGGNFFPDGCVNYPKPKPWNATNSAPMRNFWEKRNDWYPTWTRQVDDSAMQIDYIRVYSP